MPDTTYDAVLIDRLKVQGILDSDKLEWLKNTFGPVLGSERVNCATVGKDLFLTAWINPLAGKLPEKGHSRYHHNEHPLVGEERYVWTDQTKGIRYGLLTEEAKDA